MLHCTMNVAQASEFRKVYECKPDARQMQGPIGRQIETLRRIFRPSEPGSRKSFRAAAIPGYGDSLLNPLVEIALAHTAAMRRMGILGVK